MAKLKYAYDKLKRKIFLDFWKLKKPEDFFEGKITDYHFFQRLFTLQGTAQKVIQTMLARWMKIKNLRHHEGYYVFNGDPEPLTLREVFPSAGKDDVPHPTPEEAETLDLLDTLHLVHHHRDRARLSAGEDTLLFTKEFREWLVRMRHLDPIPDTDQTPSLSAAEKKIFPKIYESLYYHELQNPELLEAMVKKGALFYGFDSAHRPAFAAPELSVPDKPQTDPNLLYATHEGPPLFITAVENRIWEKWFRKRGDDQAHPGFFWYRAPELIDSLADKIILRRGRPIFPGKTVAAKYRFLIKNYFPELIPYLKQLHRVFKKESFLSAHSLPRRFRLHLIKHKVTQTPTPTVEQVLEKFRELNLLVKAGDFYGRNRLLWKKILFASKRRKVGPVAGAAAVSVRPGRLVLDSDLQITAYRSTLTPDLLRELLALGKVQLGDHHLRFQFLAERAAYYLFLGKFPEQAEALLRREAGSSWTPAVSEHLRLLFSNADFIRPATRHLLTTYSPGLYQRLKFLLEEASIPFTPEDVGGEKALIFLKSSDYKKAKLLLRKNNFIPG